MSLAFTNLPFSDVEMTLTSNGVGEMIDLLSTILTGVGWEATSIDGGYEYTLTSPQELTATVRIWDPDETEGDVRYAYVQFLPDGVRHRLGAKTGRTYRVWANCCQLFIAAAGYTGSQPLWHTVCGGIPWVPNPATDETLEQYIIDTWGTCESIWWSQGGGNEINAACSFRNELNNWNAQFRNFWSAHYNGETISSGEDYPGPFPGHSYASVRTLSIQNSGFKPEAPDPRTPPRSWFWNDRPMALEPWLAWGDLNEPPALRGMHWDALVVTKTYGAVDATANFDSLLENETMTDITWRQFTKTNSDLLGTVLGDWFGGLYLLAGSGNISGGVKHYAY